MAPVRLDASVRSDSDYGITTTARNLTEAVLVVGATVTFWGVPADHNGPGPAIRIVERSSFWRPRGGPASPSS